MTIHEFFGLLTAAGIAAIGIGLTCLTLARMAGAPAEVEPFRKLKMEDLLLAGVIFLGAQPLFVSLLPEDSFFATTIPGRLLCVLFGGVLAWVFLGVREGSFLPRRSAVAFRKVSGASAVFRCYLLGLPGLLGVTWLNNRLVEWWTGELPVQGLTTHLASMSPTTLGLFFLMAVFTQPLIEEGLFRGYLWRYLAGRADFGPRRALLFSGLVFACFHQELTLLLPLLYLGVLLGWIYWRSGKLRHAVAIHALHNALAGTLQFVPHDFLS